MDAIRIAMVGIIATLAADLWQQGLKRGAGLPAANWRLVGRWVAWMSRGVFRHRCIAATPAMPGEAAIGWAFHYLVGILYAAFYLAAAASTTAPAAAVALLFATATLSAPWLILQPALGLGVMARLSPERRNLALVTATTHLAFGLGLYVGGRLAGLLAPAVSFARAQSILPAPW